MNNILNILKIFIKEFLSTFYLYAGLDWFVRVHGINSLWSIPAMLLFVLGLNARYYPRKNTHVNVEVKRTVLTTQQEEKIGEILREMTTIEEHMQ